MSDKALKLAVKSTLDIFVELSCLVVEILIFNGWRGQRLVLSSKSGILPDEKCREGIATDTCIGKSNW